MISVERADDRAVLVVSGDEQRLPGDRLRELLERRRRARLGELGKQAVDRLEQLRGRLVRLLDPHRRSLDIRRSLSMRPSVWHSGQ